MSENAETPLYTRRFRIKDAVNPEQHHYPARLASLTGMQHHRASLEYLIRLAALHHNKAGSLPELAEAIGIGPTRLHDYIRRGYITTPICERLPPLVPSAAKFGVTTRNLSRFCS